MDKLFNKIPLWIINAISIISGIVTIISAFFAFFTSYNNTSNISKLIFVSLCFFIVLLLVRMKKYQKVSFERQQITSVTYHKLTHDSRDLYFDIMRNHKEKIDNVRNLTMLYQNRLSTILNYLCNIMEKYCGQKISACIKLITQTDSKLEDLTLSTFCRSNTSDTNRGTYEISTPIRVVDNTDFLYIVNPNNDYNLNYFYQGDLKEFEKALIKNGKSYNNTNKNWANDYIGTIVCPIQIENRRLYNSTKEDSYNLIGFLCIDSKSSSAFTNKQEQFNVDIVKSFADIIYILLSQYKHYLNKHEDYIKENL